MKLPFTPLPHVCISRSCKHKYLQTRCVFPPSLTFSLLYFLHHLQLKSISLKLSPVSFEGKAGMRIEGESLKPGRVAALPDSGVKLQNMTSMKRRSELQRRALSGTLQCFVFYRCVSESMCTHTFSSGSEREKSIIELFVCSSLPLSLSDENNNTIRPIRTRSVLWNWHFSWYIYCYFWEAFVFLSRQ